MSLSRAVYDAERLNSKITQFNVPKATHSRIDAGAPYLTLRQVWEE